MVQVALIAAFISLYLRDQYGGLLLDSASPGRAAWAELGGAAAIVVMTHAVVWWQGRRLDRTGSARAVRTADAAVLASRLVMVGVHIFAVLALGWLDTVRRAVGDLVLVDELLTVAPVLAVLCAGWWSLYPIDRRLREAALMRSLDEGAPIRPMPGRPGYVVMSLRHQAALVVVPVILIWAWTETVNLGVTEYRWLRRPEVEIGVRLAGLALVLTMMPLVLRRVWHTSALGAGPLRESLTEMCRRQRVRVRELLVWGTHGTMINGAVMGFFGRVRFILLTDALLDALPARQIEAVMAHELGHVKRRHMLWLGIAAVCSITLVQAGLLWSGQRALGSAVMNGDPAQAGVAAASLALGLLVFGFVSRRFEWQADAFAAAHLSGAGARGDRAVPVTADAVEAMCGALDTVARLNRIPLNRFTWRHGSISTRLRRLGSLVGRRADDLPIDREARVVKVLCLIGVAAVIGIITWETMREPARRSPLETDHALREDARDR